MCHVIYCSHFVKYLLCCLESNFCFDDTKLTVTDFAITDMESSVVPKVLQGTADCRTKCDLLSFVWVEPSNFTTRLLRLLCSRWPIWGNQ